MGTGSVGALAFHAAVSHTLAPVPSLEPPPLADRVGAVRGQLELLRLLGGDASEALRSGQFECGARWTRSYFAAQ